MAWLKKNTRRKLWLRASPPLLILFSGLLLANGPVLAQKKAQTKTASKKVVDSRLNPPAIREFNHSLEVSSDYDRFENQTKVTLRIQLNSVESMYMFFGFGGQAIKQVPKTIIFQYFMDAEKIVLTPKEAIFLTDRDRFRVKLVALPELGNGKVPFAAAIDYPTFLRIVNGQSVAFKIGDTENYFDDEGLEALKDFASRTNPNADRSKELASTNAVAKSALDDVSKLRKLTPKVKAQIKEILERLELAQVALRKATNMNSMDKEGIKIVGGIVPDLVERLKVIPEGPFKQLIRWTSEDLFSAIMIAGGNAGVFDATTPQFKELTKDAITRHKLNDFPDDEHVSILLTESEKSLSNAMFMASAANIVERQ